MIHYHRPTLVVQVIWVVDDIGGPVDVSRHTVNPVTRCSNVAIMRALALVIVNIATGTNVSSTTNVAISGACRLIIVDRSAPRQKNKGGNNAADDERTLEFDYHVLWAPTLKLKWLPPLFGRTPPCQQST